MMLNTYQLTMQTKILKTLFSIDALDCKDLIFTGKFILNNIIRKQFNNITVQCY